MTTSSSRSFQTAAFRRRGGPLKFTVQHWELPEDPESEDMGHEVTVELMVDPHLDAVRLGALFGGVGETLKGFADSTVSQEEKIAGLERELPKVRASVRQALVPPSRLKWDQVSADVDIVTIGEVVRWITAELSGMDPTQPMSSSDGSSTTSPTSTDGPQPATSTSSDSPSDGA